MAGKTIDVTNFPQSGEKLSRISRQSKRKIVFVETYLIGHLSKNYFQRYDSEISGTDLIQRALQIIKDINTRIGINVIRVDCIPHDKVLKFYKIHGFQILHPISRKHKLKKTKAKSHKLVLMIRSVR